MAVPDALLIREVLDAVHAAFVWCGICRHVEAERCAVKVKREDAAIVAHGDDLIGLAIFIFHVRVVDGVAAVSRVVLGVRSGALASVDDLRAIRTSHRLRSIFR